MRIGNIILLTALVGMLGGTAAAAIYMFNSLGETALGIHGWIAMALGGFFSIAVGVGLMGLLFYSSRRGYDEPPTFQQEPKSWPE